MAKLIINPTSSSRRDLALPRSLLSIGRDPSNDLVLPDAMVSRRHAVIEFRGSQYVLRDCNSSNGSLVNGDRVTERGLRDGDLVAIGTARLLFRDEVAGEEAGAKVVQHPSAPRLVCPSCSADYRKGDQFCRQCGAGLAPSTPARAVCTVLRNGGGAAREVLQRVRTLPGTRAVPGLSNHGGSGVGRALGARARIPTGRLGSGPGRAAPSKPDLPRCKQPRRRLSATARPPAGAPATPEVSAAAIPVAVAAPVATSPFTPLREPKRKPPADTIDPGTVPFLRHPWCRPPASKPIQGLGSGGAMRSAIGAAPAGFGRRLAAGLIDHALVAFGQALLVAPVGLVLVGAAIAGGSVRRHLPADRPVAAARAARRDSRDGVLRLRLGGPRSDTGQACPGDRCRGRRQLLPDRAVTSRPPLVRLCAVGHAAGRGVRHDRVRGRRAARPHGGHPSDAPGAS
jgi:hypothetical protein